MNPHLNSLRGSPFVALRALLDPLTPKANVKPLALTIGEPQNQPPEFMKEVLAEQDHQYGKYPPADGTPDQRNAISRWLNRRYDLPGGMVAEDRHIAPVNGTKEALYMIAQTVIDPTPTAAGKPVILMPNPYYHVYHASAVMAGAEPVFLDAEKENNFFPDLDQLTPELLDRTGAFYLCSPSNPQGTIAGRDYLVRVLELARKHDFVLIMDECYTEIYDREVPIGILEVCRDLGGSLENVLSFHSLSKRSSAAGLRSGFVAGDEKIIKPFLNLRNFAGAASPLPVCAASAALWDDDSHVALNRDRYRTNIDIAERILKDRFEFYRPPGGFFLWLNVGDSVEATRKLWTEGGVRVLPGEYLAGTNENGHNPGAAYIRVALVFDPDMMEEALTRLANIL
ncbi:aminotransferase class I/II-fold pyridoxal phosphate-dependent enzyme [Sneathiella chinensis]|nr:aminotransferase class I/II-fold pyridoxal phosphate-dependent enzyme [Sneathiella chinensis]